MDSDETYVYKSEVNWSLLTEGLTLLVENQVVFARNMGHFLHRGEAKAITLYLN
jgi:5-methylcytosine-specific restriction protein A